MTSVTGQPAIPVISVIVPAYNSAATLGASLDSLLSQTIRDIEIIVVYDKSKDDTEAVLARYAEADSRVIPVLNDSPPCNGRLAAALNKGVSLARAPFLARMDSDDLALPTRFEDQLNYLMAHPLIDICGTAAIIIDREGREIAEFHPAEDNKAIRIVIEYAPPLFHPTWMMRRKILNVLKGYRDLPYAEDYDFLLRAMDAGFGLGNCHATGIRYRRDPSHRALTVNHKAANYVHRMHRRRRRGLPDDFSIEGFKKATGKPNFPAIEAFGRRLIERGFTLADKRRPWAPLVIAVGLIFVPASAELAWRKFISKLRFLLHARSKSNYCTSIRY